MKSAQALNFRQNLNLSLQQIHQGSGLGQQTKSSSKKRLGGNPMPMVNSNSHTSTTQSIYRNTAQIIKK